MTTAALTTATLTALPAASFAAPFASAPTGVRWQRPTTTAKRLPGSLPRSWNAVVTPLLTELPLVATLAVMTYAITRLF